MGYKWKPSKSARREFAQKMQNDVEFANDYYARKELKAEKQRKGSKFDYNSAGGNYTPTRQQHDFCFNHPECFETSEEINAKNIIMSGYAMNEPVYHDFIHIVNEKLRHFTFLQNQ